MQSIVFVTGITSILRRHKAFPLAAAILALSACSQHETAPEQARPVISVEVHEVESAEILTLPGDLHARYEMPLSFRVGGKLMQRDARLGQQVKRGQVLAQLDGADATSNRVSAEAALSAAEHRLLYATQQKDRDEAQAKANLISVQQLQQTLDSYASALEARKQAREQLSLASNQLSYTRLVADRDGVITSEQAEVGETLSAGQPVFGFAWNGDKDIWINIPEEQIGRVKIGQMATVTFPSLSSKSYSAKIRDLSSAADPQTRTYRAKLALGDGTEDLVLGLTAQVTLSAGAAVRGVSLPATALFHKDTQPAVWVIGASDGALELRPVSVARYGERNIIVDKGLSSGERVVAQGVHTVTAGEKVKPVTPPHPEDAP